MIEGDSELKRLKDMVTVKEAAKQLGLSRARVQQFIDEGRLPAQKVASRIYLLDAKDVRKFSRIPRKAGRKPKTHIDNPS